MMNYSFTHVTNTFVVVNGGTPNSLSRLVIRDIDERTAAFQLPIASGDKAAMEKLKIVLENALTKFWLSSPGESSQAR